MDKVYFHKIKLIWLLLAAVTSPCFAEETLKVEPIDEALPFYEADLRRVRNALPDDAFPPLRVLMAKSRFWAQEKYLSLVVQIDPRAAGVELEALELELRVLTPDGVSQHLIRPDTRAAMLYPAIPESLHAGGVGTIEVVLRQRGGDVIAHSTEPFRVETFAQVVSTSGMVPLTISNGNKVSVRGLPITAGVPFPMGVLADTVNLRLIALDQPGRPEIPFQVESIAKWSKWGSIKWVHVSFTVDVEGGERRLGLEYGPDINTPATKPMTVSFDAGKPQLDAGLLKVDDGLWYAGTSGKAADKVLGMRSLDGGFVKLSDGPVYRSESAGEWEVELSGSVKTVLKKSGWYRDDESGAEYCQFLTRLYFYQDSPMVKITYSWIFTGDGNTDTIENMGWEFSLAQSPSPLGFLTPHGAWQKGQSLLQWDYEHFDILQADRVQEFAGQRAPGVAGLAYADEVSLFLGVRDFWQNYPSELEYGKDVLWFHNWPRHNRPAGYTFEGELTAERGEPALPSAARHAQYTPGKLSRSEWTLNLLQARFAHEGEVLNFRLPYEVTVDPVHSIMRAGRPWIKYWRVGEPESVNAQGISRTEEMWLYLQPTSQTEANAAAIIDALNAETLRAVVDPKWMTGSGAFYEIHYKDTERFPEEERLYEKLALAPGKWREHLGLYGMWIYGDITGWNLELERREPDLYRAYRKRHHGWPFSWIPYARSGDSRFLHEADIATRQNIDANWKHYATDGRKRGVIHRSTLPWASTFEDDENATRTRDYESKVDYLLFAWYMNDYYRAWDLFQDWMRLTKVDDTGKLRGPIDILGPFGKPVDTRFPLTMLKSYVETYEATFDPWFLVAAHALAEGYEREYEEEGSLGTPYVTAFREYQRFTGDDYWREIYLAYADYMGGISATHYVDPLLEPDAYAWKLTGEDHYLGRLQHFSDWTKASIWDGEEPDFIQGFYVRGDGHTAPRTTGWMLRYYPLALHALATADKSVAPVANEVYLIDKQKHIAFLHEGDAPQTISLRQSTNKQGKGKPATYRLTGPGGELVEEGEWDVVNGKELTLAQSAPPGLYHLHVAGTQRLVVPVVLESDAKEVIVAEPGGRVDIAGYHNQLWFYVPEGVESFDVELAIHSKGNTVRRFSIWAPDGELVWNDNYYKPSHRGGKSYKLSIPVKPEQAGQLWRVTEPGGYLYFKPEAVIPPYFSSDVRRWFRPE